MFPYTAWGRTEHTVPRTTNTWDSWASGPASKDTEAVTNKTNRNVPYCLGLWVDDSIAIWSVNTKHIHTLNPPQVRQPALCANTKHKVLRSYIWTKKRKEDWCTSTVLTAVSYPHCWPVDRYTGFVCHTADKSVDRYTGFVGHTADKAVDIYTSFVYQTDDEATDVYTSFVYQTDDKVIDIYTNFI